MCLVLIGLAVLLTLIGLAGVQTLIRVLLPRPLFISLPYSHYVELARWALERPLKPIPHYHTLAVPIGPHVPIVAAIRLCFSHGTSQRSFFPGMEIPQTWYSVGSMASLRRLSGLPAFITAEGSCKPDSWSILEYAGYAIDRELQHEFDAVLAPSVRRAGYYWIFSARGMYRKLQSCGPWLMLAFDVNEYLLPAAKIMPGLMGIDEQGVQDSVAKIRLIFASVSSTLEHCPFLGSGGGGSTFGGADLAFAALAGYVLLPVPQYHNGQAWLPNAEELPPPFRNLCKELRATRAGRHALRCYDDYRVQGSTRTPAT